MYWVYISVDFQSVFYFCVLQCSFTVRRPARSQLLMDIIIKPGHEWEESDGCCSGHSERAYGRPPGVTAEEQPKHSQQQPRKLASLLALEYVRNLFFDQSPAQNGDSSRGDHHVQVCNSPPGSALCHVRIPANESTEQCRDPIPNHPQSSVRVIYLHICGQSEKQRHKNITDTPHNTEPCVF